MAAMDAQQNFMPPRYLFFSISFWSKVIAVFVKKLPKLNIQGVGCHMNGMFVGAFCYADDVTLLAPTGMALNAILDTCTRFADTHNLLLNSSKAKCMFIDRSCLQLHSDVRFMGRSVEFVNSVDLLEVLLYTDLKVNHIHRNVQEFYCKVNSVFIDFKDVPSDVTSKIIRYLLLYGSQLWKYSKNDVKHFILPGESS